MNNDPLIDRLQIMKKEINQRLDGLLLSKYGSINVDFEDIDERISDCINAIDNLEKSINHIKNNSQKYGKK